MSRSVLAAAGLLVPLLAATQIHAAPAVKKQAAAPAQKPAQSPPPAPEPPDFPKMLGEGVSKSLVLLQNSTDSFNKQRACMSCHHQLLSQFSVDLARHFGFKPNESQAKANGELIGKQLGFIQKVLQDPAGQAKADAQLDRILVDPAVNAGYIFVGLKASAYPKDEAAQAFALYLGRKQMEDGRWPVIAGRPPQESSDFTATALAVRALKEYAPSGSAEEINGRIAKAREWLTARQPKTAEDRAFRLMGLVWSGAEPGAIRSAIEGAFEEQQDDGGWAQLPARATDAYATGLTLTALQFAGVTPADPRYIKGAVYLGLRQRPDGSWKVTTRSQPAQPYFETGFPHKEDQFISAAATAWATIALLPMAEPPGGAGAVSARR